MSWCQVCIGKPVVIAPGLYLPHGQVVVDGITSIGPDCILFPWVTIGLRAGNFQGPSIEAGVHVGTGAKVIGPVSVGAGAKIGANAVVVADVPQGMTAVGVPAHHVSSV
jgi:serine O-acetyltransferase